jgi:hypothetical protein
MIIGPLVRTIVLVVLIGAVPWSATLAEPPRRLTIRAQAGEQWIEGMPLDWSGDVQLLGRDGHIWSINPRTVRQFERVEDDFRGYSAAEMRDRLLAEFGRRFEVTGSGQFLVVHPAGVRDRWAERFEQLYRSMLQYFAVRGFRVREPDFPLVAIVLADRNELHHYATREGFSSTVGILGFYSLRTNRVILLDETLRGTGSTARDDRRWARLMATIFHEAAHQTAFNVGVHSRTAAPPRWLSEGLGMLFEAPGIWNPQAFPDPLDRINHDRLADFRRRVGWLTGEQLAEMVSSDAWFDNDPVSAYATAWAWTFYLSETQPQRYAELLARTAAAPPFRTSTAAQRQSEFVELFGGEFAMHAARLLRFTQDLERD